MSESGCLEISPECAKLIIDAETFDKMNPYCVLTVNSTTLRTQSAEGAGKFPNWHDSLQFVSSPKDSISLSVYHKDSLSREIKLGEAILKVLQIVQNNNTWNDWVVISSQDIKTGDVRLNCKWTPGGTVSNQVRPVSLVDERHPSEVKSGTVGNNVNSPPYPKSPDHLGAISPSTGKPESNVPKVPVTSAPGYGNYPNQNYPPNAVYQGPPNPQVPNYANEMKYPPNYLSSANYAPSSNYPPSPSYPTNPGYPGYHYNAGSSSYTGYPPNTGYPPSTGYPPNEGLNTGYPPSTAYPPSPGYSPNTAYPPHPSYYPNPSVPTNYHHSANYPVNNNYAPTNYPPQHQSVDPYMNANHVQAYPSLNPVNKPPQSGFNPGGFSYPSFENPRGGY